MATDYPTSIDSYSTKVNNVTTVTAADVNDLQDAVVALETKLAAGSDAVGQWTNFTPVITQLGNVTFSTTLARYAVVNKVVLFEMSLTITGSGTTTNVIQVDISDIPTAKRPTAGALIGSCYVLDSGTAAYIGAAYAQSSTVLYMGAHNLANNFGITPDFGLANNDTIRIKGFWGIA